MTDSDTAAEPIEPASARLDPEPGEWRRVSPKFVVVDLVGTLVTGLLITAVATLPVVLFGWNLWWVAVPVAIGVVTIVAVCLTPRRVRSIGYRFRTDDLLFRRGIMFQRFVAVPFGRMQLVDITRGPLARSLGLAELRLVTASASSGVIIPGLPLEEAEELRDRLVELAETRRAGL